MLWRWLNAGGQILALAYQQRREATEPLLFGAIAGATSILGTLLVLFWRDWTTKHSHFVNSMAAGLILGVAFLGLMPEAIELSPHALGFVLIGFMIFYVLETALVFHSGSEIHFESQHDRVSAGRAWVIFAGLFLHSFIDGIVIGVGFEVSHQLGLLAATSVILHELPEGISTFALLINRLDTRSTLRLSLAVCLATPLGAMLGMAVLPGMSPTSLGAVLAATAGSFVYIGASDLVPETHTHVGWINAVFLIAGAVLAYFLFQAVR